MRRIIKIFLASSIVEFANERMAIENFIRNISDKFEENYDVKIQPLLCENLDDAYSKIRKQEEYNEKIRNSDLCFFIFFTKAGEYTREEFEVARKKFEETGKPKIYTYFKVIKDETAEQSLYDFMNELDKTFGHYYGTFEHIDTVKLRILLNLKLQEMDFLEIKVDGDACVVDGKKTLSLENVSEFANNSIFQELKAELYEVEESYFNLKAKYEKDECSQSEEREYIEIASKRQNLIDAIEEIQKNIFNMSLRMCQDEARGEITLRQKEAYRLFAAGDLEGANNILDFTEIENDYLRDIAIMEANMRKRSGIFIRETKAKIDILKTMTKLPTRFAEIEELYDKILPVVFKFNIEYDTAFDCVNFLYDQNINKKALEIGKQLEEIYEKKAEVIDKENAVDLFHLLGVICADLPLLKDEAESYLLKAVEMSQNSESSTPNNQAVLLGSIYNSLGAFYSKQNKHLSAMSFYLKSIEKLSEDNSTETKFFIAKVYNNLGGVCEYCGQPQNIEFYYQKSIELYKNLFKLKPKHDYSGLPTVYYNLACFYDEHCQPQKAEEFYLKASQLANFYANENPERFNDVLASIYNRIGRFYRHQHSFDKAKNYYLKSIEIRGSLSARNPERFLHSLAESCCDTSIFFCESGWFPEAEELYLRVVTIYEQLTKTNPERFNYDLAMSYNNIGAFYDFNANSLKDSDKSENYYKKSIKIMEELAEKNNPGLVMSYNNIALFYCEHEQAEKAEPYYLKSIGICKALAQTNRQKYLPLLAVNYNNLGKLYYDTDKSEQAVKYYLKAMKIREKLVDENPKRFSSDLAVSYYNFALLNKDINYLRKALGLAKTLPNDPLCKQIIEAAEGK